VKEEGSNAPISGATVIVKDTSLSTTSDGSGRYTIGGLGGGRAVLRATRSGYRLAEVDVNVTGNVTMDVPMRKESSPAPSPTPSPSPSPTPPPGSNTCAASSIPANATCVGNGTPPVTAVCNDGAFSCAQNRQGTCSSHGGVRCWVCPGTLCNGITTSASAVPLDYTPVPVFEQR
jgi:hypothetical protein